MGEVYEAVDTDKDRTVALKLLTANLADNAAYRARFLRESQTVARLNDPHVIPIHDFGEIDGRLYLDMRIVHGRDLRTIIDAGPLSPDHAVGIVSQIAGALDAAHTSGLLHRDVKPENILVDDNGFAYLVDFGIARAADSTRLTQTGTAIGSFAYMAPERFGDAADLTPAADVYSLACVLYEALTGAPPYAATSIEQIIGGHLARPVPPTGTALDPVIAAGTAKDPVQRVQSCGALAAAARDALSRRHAPTAVATVPPPPSYSTHQPPARSDNGRTALIAALVVLAVVVVAGGTWLGLRERPDDTATPDAAASTTTTVDAAESAETTTVTVDSTTDAVPETTESRAVGDLGLDTPISTPPCDGRTVTFVVNATTPGRYAEQVSAALSQYPGSQYLRTDQSCSSLRQDLNGNAIYGVYLEGTSLTDICRIKAEIGGEAYARRLDETSEVGADIC